MVSMHRSGTPVEMCARGSAEKKGSFVRTRQRVGSSSSTVEREKLVKARDS